MNASMDKLLVIGTKDYAGIKCVEWFAGPVPNAADFHVVVINSISLSRILEEAERDDEKGVPIAEIATWQKWLGGLRERLRNLIKTGGKVFAIVDGKGIAYGMRTMGSMKGLVELPAFVSAQDWLPLPIQFNSERGVTVTVKDMVFARYMAAVKAWQFHLAIDLDGDQISELRAEHPEGEVAVRLLPIAVDRQGLPIAATAFYTVHEQSGRRTLETPSHISGLLHLVPPPTEASTDEALAIILEDFCGIPARISAPEWITSVSMPGAERIDADIRAKEKEIEGIQTELTPLLTERRRREQFKAILYETGIKPLQDVVKAVFEELGLTTKPSKVSDEFVVEHEGSEFLVEVKGNERSAKLTDLRQLIDYQLEHEQQHGSSIKSALIVNAWRLIPPEKRGEKDTVIFPDNVIKRARANNIALLDTVDLYNALNCFWLGQIDGVKVFEPLSDTSGVVKLI